MKSLLELIKLLYGPKALSQTIGTRTNVISLTNKKFDKYIKTPLNIEEASDAAAVNAYKEMEKLVVDVPKMNDSERLIFEGNLRRTKNKLQASGLIPPDETAEIVSMTTKEPVSKEGIKELIKESGQQNPPGTLMGDIESRINRLKNLTKEEGTTIQDVVGDFASGQKGMLKLRDEGLVRSTARQIMFNDIKSGKLKASKEVQDIVSGKASGDPIDSFRTIYGEDALEQLDSLTPDLRQLKTEVDAEKLARSKFEFTPKLDRPKESYTPEEMEKILKDKDPEEFAKGGSVGLGYLVGLGTEDTTRENFGFGSIIKTVAQEPAAGLMIRLDRPLQPGDPVGSYYSPPGDGSGLTSIIRAVPQPSAPSITLDAKPAVVRPEDDVVNRYREYLNASNPVQSDLEKRYREFINPPKQELMLMPMTRPGDTRSLEQLRSFTSSEVDSLGRRYDDPRYYSTGGRAGFEKGSIPEEEDEEPSEEYIKSRQAGRFKYSFDVQGPDSRIKKSGLPGRTNPKDYGLGITYLPNPGNETAPEIRVGGSRRGAGIEIRKKFKDGGLGYLVGE